MLLFLMFDWSDSPDAARMRMQLLVGCCVFCLLLLLVILFGNTLLCRRTPLGWLYRLISGEMFGAGSSSKSTNATPKRKREPLPPPPRPRGILELVTYPPKYLGYLCAEFFIYRRHPLLQIFYAVLISALYAAFLVDCYAKVHRVHQIGSWIAFLATIASFIKACWAEPGVVTPLHVHRMLRIYPYDNIMYGAKDCSTCKVPRPARSKHCTVCDRCVHRFDHHCGWINNCVGAYNLRWFLLMLFMTAFLSTYCVVVTGDLVWQVAVENKLLLAYNHPRGGLSYCMRVLISDGGFAFTLLFFCSMLTVMVTLFLAYQLSLIVRGTTTNETFKLAQIKRYKQFAQQVRDDPNFRDEDGSKVEYTDELKFWAEVPLQKPLYHRGFLKNMYEVCFPEGFERERLAKTASQAVQASDSKKAK
jgi:palmitoyltransferase